MANINEEDEDEEEIKVRTHFDHENLDVYQLELRFVTWVTGLLGKIKQRPTNARIAEVSDQLDREAAQEEKFAHEEEDEDENENKHGPLTNEF